MRKSTALSIAAAIASASFAQAAEPMETLVVTARRPPPVGREAFSSVTLNAAALRSGSSLDGALRQVPGLSLFRRNSSLSANPTTQGVSLRGIGPSGAGRALVTLDGVPQNDPFGGWVIWSGLPAESLAAAEITRGAGSGPYGAGALTGTIDLAEADGPGLTALDVSGGNRDQRRAALAGGTGGKRLSLFAAASHVGSGGWIPVDEHRRGAADSEVTLAAHTASLRLQARPRPNLLISARGAWYDEKRDAGLAGTGSEASGTTASLTVAQAEAPSQIGFRVQGWMRKSNLQNKSASVSPTRDIATPSNDQYAIPALGWGVNAALRGQRTWLSWELGGDLRFASGESRERLQLISGAFQQNRVSGGKSFVGGAYFETAARLERWLLTLGLRADSWASTNGHLQQTQIATGTETLADRPASARGVVPSARAGVRRVVGETWEARAAAYSGFRVASLNELYRSFRLGNNITQSNAALRPERLYGVEIGAGRTQGRVRLSLTGFWNRLHDAITNVTIGAGPGTFPGVGFVPAGGLLIQRRNAGDIDAYGLETEVQWTVSEALALKAAAVYTHARVDGGANVPALTGRRPAQAPRWTVTAELVARPLTALTLTARGRFEGLRYSDDLNTLPLKAAATLDVEGRWALTQAVSLYVTADNVFDAKVATSSTADRVLSYDAPRLFRFGLTVSS